MKALLWLVAALAWGQIPRLERPVTVDGSLAEWKNYAFSDGLWDMERLRQSPWYDPAINRLTVHGKETGVDLAARYYIAWDDKYLYLGADVQDNINDVIDPAHAPKRWYYKDAICWFIEAPRLATGKKFGKGDLPRDQVHVAITVWVDDKLKKKHRNAASSHGQTLDPEDQVGWRVGLQALRT